MPTPTIFHLGALAGATSLTAARIKEIRTLGFSGLIVSLPDLACIAPQPALVERVAKLARLCHSEELVLLCELELFNLDPSHPLVAAQPELFALRPSFSGGIVDPRQRDRPQGRALLRTERPIAAVVEFWAEVIGVLRRAGCGGFCLRQSGGLGPALCARLIADAGKTLWIADATAQDWARMLQLRGCGFDHVLGSLPWWDYRHSWFVEEHALLSRIAPVMSHVESWQKLPPLRTQARCARLAVAALAGVGLLLPAGFVGMSEAEDRQQQLLACIRAANRYVSETGATRRRLSQRTGPCAPVLLEAERRQACFSSWYELFPRSLTTDKRKHGTLRAVIEELPRITAMGFDVLYLPPIHPIGHTNRKGANNTVNAKPGEPGSSYAIGSAQGGHDAIHPELGSFEDFQALLAACRDYGIELALDFAIQCSPDHPWLKEHPGWFDYRPDGSIKYAENPPKKYEDIVNLDFYKPDACPALWLGNGRPYAIWRVTPARET